MSVTHYFYYTPGDGRITQRGHTAAPELLHLDMPLGQALALGFDAGDATHYINGQLIKQVEDAPYGEYRRLAYPPLSEFADAFYWHLKGKSELINEWVAKVDAVKAQFPKQSEQA